MVPVIDETAVAALDPGHPRCGLGVGIAGLRCLLVGTLIAEIIGWITVERVSVSVAVLALIGVVYSGRAVRLAKEQAASSKQSADAALSQAESAKQQANLAHDQVDFGRQQIDLLLKQIEQTERAEAAARQAQQDSLQPMVVVDISSGVDDPSVLVMSVANIGPSIARNVKISVAPPPTRSFDRPGKKPMHEWNIFTKGVKAMPPGHKMHFFFDVGFRRFSESLPRQFTFLVDAEGPFGSTPQLAYEIDLEPLAQVWIGQTTIKKVADKLDGLNRGLAELTDAVRLLDPEEAKARQRNHEAALAELEGEVETD